MEGSERKRQEGRDKRREVYMTEREIEGERGKRERGGGEGGRRGEGLRGRRGKGRGGRGGQRRGRGWGKRSMGRSKGKGERDKKGEEGN